MMTKDEIRQRSEARAVGTFALDALDGGEVRLRKLSTGAVIRAQGKRDADALLISKSVIDEAGDEMYTVEEAGELPADLFAELGREVGKFNGWLKTPEQAEKN